MKIYTIAAILLIATGIVVFAYQGISYTTPEEIVEFGPIRMMAEKERTLALSPILGGIALVGGIAWLAMGKRNT